MARARVKKGMSGLEIKIGLMRKGIKLSDIAARAGVSPAAVTRALDDNDKYHGLSLRPFIAEALGLPESAIWTPAEKQRLAQ